MEMRCWEENIESVICYFRRIGSKLVCCLEKVGRNENLLNEEDSGGGDSNVVDGGGDDGYGDIDDVYDTVMMVMVW